MQNAQASYDYNGVLINVNGKLEKYNGTKTEQLMKDNVAWTGWEFYQRVPDVQGEATVNFYKKNLGKDNIVVVHCSPETEGDSAYKEIYTRGSR